MHDFFNAALGASVFLLNFGASTSLNYRPSPFTARLKSGPALDDTGRDGCIG